MALIKKYKCMNIGGCKNANEKTVFEIPVGEELICPVCKKKMLVEVNGVDWKKIAVIAGVAVVVVLLGYFFLSGRGDAPAQPPVGGGEGTDTTQTVPGTNVAGQDSARTDTALTSPEELGGTVRPAEEGDVPEDPDQRVILELGYGTYTGKVKNGKPHDPNGTIVYKQAHRIEERDVHERVAQPGERVTGNFENGHLVNGTWFKKDGNREHLTIGGE